MPVCGVWWILVLKVNADMLVVLHFWTGLDLVKYEQNRRSHILTGELQGIGHFSLVFLAF